MKAQLDETIKKNKELIKKNDVTLMQLETQLIEALQYADKVQELACAENIDKVHAPTVDKKGMIPRMQLKGLEENAVNTFHERAGNENDSKVVQVNNENVDLVF
uniref:Uncharacterized protein n=1 Tax=Panagrolaimus superbus TaxID=310955 RepID=A0A914YSM6_9BILA